MAYKVQRLSKRLNAREVALLENLDASCFPNEDPYPKIGSSLTWWVVWDVLTSEPVAFGGSRFWKPDNAMFLCRAGVLARARGNGLQRRLIRARLRHARERKTQGVMTYTSIDNYASVNNLIRCGVTLWEPGIA